jgi:hypothetical protein
VAEGKLPAERLTPSQLFFVPEWSEEEERTFIITKRLVKKCRDLIQFNVESSNDTQQQASVKEFIKVFKIYMNLVFIRDIKADSNSPYAVRAAEELELKNLDSYRVQAKIFRAKMERIDQVYGSRLFVMLEAIFNYQLFKNVLEDYFEDERRRKEKEEKKRKRDQLQTDPKDRGRSSTFLQFNKLNACVVSMMLLMLMLGYLVLNGMGYSLPFSNTQLISVLNKPMDPSLQFPKK